MKINLNLEKLKAYQYLISMGFDEVLSLNAIKKYGNNVNKCINYIESKSNQTTNQQKSEQLNQQQHEDKSNNLTNETDVLSKQPTSDPNKVYNLLLMCLYIYHISCCMYYSE